MSRALIVLLLVALPALTASAQKKNATIIGEVVDVVSYMTTGSKPDSPEGKEVLTASMQKGNPLGILESGTGTLYLVTMKQANTGANETLRQWIGMKVAAKGDIYRKGSSRVVVLTVIGKSIQ